MTIAITIAINMPFAHALFRSWLPSMQNASENTSRENVFFRQPVIHTVMASLGCHICNTMHPVPIDTVALGMYGMVLQTWHVQK
jgi:hypothetical protein